MPLEMPEPDDDEEPRPRKRFEEPENPWWRPAGKLGRTLLALSALAIVCGLVAGFLFVRHALERDSRFRIAGVDHIQAAGLSQVSRAEMLPVFGEDIGKNIFFVHLSDRRKQLEQIPWIEKATVMRILPDQIRVSVVERTPIAFVRQGQQIGLVDADGVLLSMPAAMMARHRYSFPVVTGIDPGDPAASRRARMAVYQRLIRELDSNGQHLSEQISEIDLTDPEDARVLMPEQGADILAHFGDDQFLARYQRYRAHIGEWRQQYPRLASVDLRYDQQVVLQMAKGDGQTAVTTGDGASAAADGANAAPAKPAAGAKAETAQASAVRPEAKPQHKPAHSKQSSAKEKKKHAELRHAAVAANHKPAAAATLRQGQ